MLIMAHIDLYLYNPNQALASYPLPSTDASINTNTDADTDVRCGLGFSLLSTQTSFVKCLFFILEEVRNMRMNF